MTTLNFTDGIRIPTAGPFRTYEAPDGWYAIGQGICIPATDRDDALAIVESMTPDREDK